MILFFSYSESEVEPRKFAVVRWSEGQDKGRVSDVKTECIRGYDDSKMDQDGNPIEQYSAYIEWRHGKKPKAGWPFYKGTLIFVAGKGGGVIAGKGNGVMIV